MTSEVWSESIEKIDENRWRIPRSYKKGMRVDGMIFANETLLKDIRNDKAVEQVANVAFLPGIVRASMAMPDIHWGYGFPIGGVCATDPKEGGVISPGGVGYDINCGVRLVRSNLEEADVGPNLCELIGVLFNQVPCGVGQGGQIRVNKEEERKVLVKGAQWAVERGFGRPEDLECTESQGRIEGADPGEVSDRALERGRDQIGTLGSGNHFLEVQVVEEIFDEEAARLFGLRLGTVTVMIHSGSRGCGYQICEDFLRRMMGCPEKYGIDIPDRQLVAAPVESAEGRAYLAAMRCGANYAWANRQLLMHLARHVFEQVFKRSEKDLGMDLVYDVAHNIAKMEPYEVDGKKRMLCVHRKGATRAFPPGHPEVPQRYRAVGQPVIIPGDMGRASYILVGQEGAMRETFGSTCHGAGRVMSRGAAIRATQGRSIRQELEAKGIIAMARGRTGLMEEQPLAYKDVNQVVKVVEEAGISKRVVRLRPLGVIKG